MIEHTYSCRWHSDGGNSCDCIRPPTLTPALDDADDLRDRLKATSDALNEARNEAHRIRRQLVDLAEERDLLVRQLVAIRTKLAEPSGIGELRRILDGR